MAKQYDAVTKRLIEIRPQDWLSLIGVSGGDVEPMDAEIVDADLATISTQADRVLKIKSPAESLFHIELESGHHGAAIPGRLLRYGVLLTGKHNLTVQSAVVLLRSEADSPALTGMLEYRRPGRGVYLTFAYSVVRIWRLPVESLLTGGIGTLPLSPLADVTPDRLPEVVRRMTKRLDAEVSEEESRELWAATKILMGLRYTRSLAEELLKGARQMRESVTYQAILDEGRTEGRTEGHTAGRLEGERQMLLRMGAKRLGSPSERVSGTISSIDSAEQLIALGERIFEVESWDDLLSAAVE